MLPLRAPARVISGLLFDKPPIRILSRAHRSHRSRFPASGPAVPPPSPITKSSTTQSHPTNSTSHKVRHEVHEGNVALNIPFNPPGGGGGPGVGGTGPTLLSTGSPLLDTALTTIVGLAMVFGGGVIYMDWYKKNVLNKIEQAFEPGYDPALHLAHHSRKLTAKSDANLDGVALDCDFTFDLYHHIKNSPYSHDGCLSKLDEDTTWIKDIRCKEQEFIHKIVQGRDTGHYYVFLGPKGSGKGTMIYESMAACDADGVAMCEAHPNLEVFRNRLGKALNFEFHEDSQTGLFQRRDPREGGPSLDIERALNKLEKVALRISAKRGHRPLILIVNNIHFFKNDDEGRNLLLQLQQRAEAWAASGVLTLLFTSDDYWPFHVMRQTGSRMHVLSLNDLNHKESVHAARGIRMQRGRSVSEEELNCAVSIVGGRLSYLSRIAKAEDMLFTAKQLQDVEKQWLLGQIGLIPDCDDDVMDEQKWSSCSWLLLQEFVKIREEKEKDRPDIEATDDRVNETLHELPIIPYWKCRQIMTRADFLEELDRLNVISIDVDHNVRPDSMLIFRAAQEVVQEEGFEELLENVRDRIDAIESLHRTRELTFKDVDDRVKLNLTVDKAFEKQGDGRIV